MFIYFNFDSDYWIEASPHFQVYFDIMKQFKWKHNKNDLN